jgi:hypothetical protein
MLSKVKKKISFIFWFCKTVPVNQALRACVHPFTMYMYFIVGKLAFLRLAFPLPLYTGTRPGGGGGGRTIAKVTFF